MNVLLGFISTVFNLIAFIFLGVFIFSLFSSKLIIKAKTTKKRALIATGLFFFIFSALGAATQPQKKEPENTAVVDITTVPTVKPTSLPTIIQTSTVEPTKKPLSPIPTQNTGRVTLDSLAVVLVAYNISQSNDSFNGFSNQNTVSLQGDKNNIKTIMFSFNHQQPSDTGSNSMYIESVLQAVLPNWKGSNVWLGNTLTQFSNSTDPEGDSAETDVDNKHILLGYAPVNSSLNLTITIK
jgi:hypothetical protein